MSIDVKIDRDLCIGSGTCARLAPGAFELDAEELAMVMDPAAVDVDKLRLAANACPTGAITLVEGDGDHDG